MYMNSAARGTGPVDGMDDDSKRTDLDEPAYAICMKGLALVGTVARTIAFPATIVTLSQPREKCPLLRGW
jgi:hypothetical protein